MNDSFKYGRLKFVHFINDLLFNIIRFPGSRKIGRTIAKIVLPKLTEIVQVPTKYNFDLFVNSNGGREIYNLGFYEPGTLNVIEKCIEEGDVFIDVGASIGLMSVFASKLKKNGKVLSFEPQSERYKILLQNIELNNSNNIIAFNNGLGESKNKEKLFTDVFSPSIVDFSNDNKKFEEIEILVLDDVLKSQRIENVSFIKIDVEGFEIDVLKGSKNILSSKNPPIICIEYVKRLQSLNKHDVTIYQFIKEINEYIIFQLEKSSNTVSKLVEINSEEQLRDYDNMYCFTESHIRSLDSSMLFK